MTLAHRAVLNRIVVAVTSVAVISTVLVACTIDSEDAASATVGNDGATIRRGGVTVVVPAAAAPRGTRVSLGPGDGVAEAIVDHGRVLADPVTVELDADRQPTAPVSVSFPVNRGRLVALPGVEVSATLVLALRSKDGGPVDLVPARWDESAQAVVAEVPHLSELWPIQIDAAAILDEVKSAFLQTLEIKFPKPKCVGDPAKIAGATYRVSSPDIAWICLQEQYGKLRADISPNSGVGYRITSSPAGEIQMSSDLNFSSALLSALLINLHARKAGVVLPGVRSSFIFDDVQGDGRLSFRQHDMVVLLRILGAVLDTALGGIGDLRWVDALAKGDCLQKVVVAGEALEAQRSAEVISGIVRGFFACADGFAKIPGPQRVVLAVFATAPGLVSTLQIELLNLITSRTEYEVGISREAPDSTSDGGADGGADSGSGQERENIVSICDRSDFAEDLKTKRSDIKVDFCRSGWAVVSDPTALGDTSRILRWAAGRWTLVTWLPSLKCQQELRDLGAPERLAEMTAPCERKVETFRVISPGRLGSLRVGMSPETAEADGLVERATEEVCGVLWDPTEGVSEQGVHLEFRAGDQALDSIDVWHEDGKAVPSIHTSAGIKIGTSVARIEAVYGDRAKRRTFEGEGGEYSAYVIFGDAGALMLNVGRTENGLGDRVVAMHAVRGTSFADLQHFVGGC